MNVRKRGALPTIVALLLAAVMLVAAACGGGSSGGSTYGGGSSGAGTTPTATPTGSSGGGAAGQEQAVTIENFSYSPAKVTIKAGTTVVWTNKDSAPHTVTATDGPSVDAKTTGAYDSGSLAQGDTFKFTFDKAGTYYYECTIHASMASMHAEIVVE